MYSLIVKIEENKEKFLRQDLGWWVIGLVKCYWINYYSRSIMVASEYFPKEVALTTFRHFGVVVYSNLV